MSDIVSVTALELGMLIGALGYGITALVRTHPPRHHRRHGKP